MEQRSAARIATSFWVAVGGDEAGLQLKKGDISVTGALFPVAGPFGRPGSVKWLRLVSSDHTHEVAVMARIVRTAVMRVSGLGDTMAVALEFLPESVESRKGLHTFVSYLVERQLDQDIDITVDHEFDAVVNPTQGEGQPGRLQSLSVHRVVLETNMPLEHGEVIQVGISSRPGQSLRVFKGEVVDVSASADGDHYRIGLRTHAESDRSGVATTVGQIVGDMPDEHSITANLCDGLVGSLGHIRTSSLLSFMEMDRMSGWLRVDRAQQTVRIYVRDGAVIDVEADGLPGNERERLRATLGWTEGDFEFHAEAIDRPDKLETSTTSLLLDLMRELDEAEAGVAPRRG